jgi:hypothetical protein
LLPPAQRAAVDERLKAIAFEMAHRGTVPTGGDGDLGQSIGCRYW